MEIWTAFLLGLVGSLHCAGMCGPLALALPATGRTRASFLLGRLNYNLGRILTYSLLGAVVGLVGESLALAGLQRWVSLAAGLAILLGLIASSRYALDTPAVRLVSWLKSGFARLLQQRSLSSLLVLGLLNGLLPCGLVYAACAGAVAAGGFFSGTQYMLAFGLGTLPMMLGLGLVGKQLHWVIRFKFQRLIPASLLLLSSLLILRGLALGIPYLSPNLSDAPGKHAACH
jgi:sulfite exporter TauE/SafE